MNGARAMLRTPARLPRPAILVAIAAAWGLSLAAELTGRGAALHHDRLLEGQLSPWLALGLFLVAWQVIRAAVGWSGLCPNRVDVDRPDVGDENA